MRKTRYTTLRYDLSPPIATITLHRPTAGNRVNDAMAADLRHACQRLREDGVHAAVVTGSGAYFSSGREAYGPSPEEAPAAWLRRRRAAVDLARVEVPLIAAVNGDAVDQGLELALACDLRLAAEGASLGFTDVKRGAIPWDGGTQLLPRLVGKGLALEMLLTSRLVGAAEARRRGLVNEVVELSRLMDRALEVAGVIASGAPIALRYAKETVLKSMDLSLEQGLGLEADLSVVLQTTRDREEGLSSFAEKREPEFTGE
ncbi:MAG: enoyl-CoA hydratase/isomerase family protein [Dehalococcoidia bacterium]|nr:enoyl-CoA hydratase/isomerase family protein [Dehalococcoidia bacterium]